MTSHRGLPSRTSEDGLEVSRQWRPPERPLNSLGLPAGSSAMPGAWWSLRRGDEDVMQAWTIPAALAAARSGKPSVFVFQGVLDEADLAGRPRVKAMLLRAARECDVVTTYSEAAAEAFTRLTGVEARAIEPGIRLDRFAPADARGADARGADARGADAARADARHPTPAIFCAADPDEPRKRVRLLVDAFARIRSERPDAELWLMRTSDPAIARAPGVRIVDPGADQDELILLYRSAWVTVLPAFREAFGLVVVESLACGTPAIVMTDSAGAAQIVAAADASAGSIVDPDEDSLAAALADAIRQPPTPGVAAGCRTHAERFSIDRCADRYEALYKELVRA